MSATSTLPGLCLPVFPADFGLYLPYNHIIQFLNVSLSKGEVGVLFLRKTLTNTLPDIRHSAGPWRYKHKSSQSLSLWNSLSGAVVRRMTRVIQSALWAERGPSLPHHGWARKKPRGRSGKASWCHLYKHTISNATNLDGLILKPGLFSSLRLLLLSLIPPSPLAAGASHQCQQAACSLWRICGSNDFQVEAHTSASDIRDVHIHLFLWTRFPHNLLL